MILIILLIFLANIILWSVGDGLNDSGKKVLGHSLKALSFLPILLSPFIIEIDYWGWYIAVYTLLRMALFDAGYNIARKLPIAYLGTSSLWDKFWQKTQSPASWIIAAKILFLITGIAMAIKEL